MNETERRAWQPGDGLSCSVARAAPREMPCGQPVVTVIRRHGVGPSGTQADVKRTYCENHAGWRDAPGAVLTKARRAAQERLIVDNWELYQKYIQEYVDEFQLRMGDQK